MVTDFFSETPPTPQETTDLLSCNNNDSSHNNDIANNGRSPSFMRRRLFQAGKKKTRIKQKKRRSQVSLPRMVDRNLPFYQSTNSMKIKNSDHKYLWRLMIIDWFHTLLRLPACISVSFLLFLWVLLIEFYAAIYWFEDNVHYKLVDCGLGVDGSHMISFAGAFAFSLETCTTVGYGLPGTSTAFFEKGCSMIQVSIFTQMVWSMMFNAFLFAFFFSLLSKSEFRSSQIIFTNKLLVNVDKGNNNKAEGNGNKAYVRLQCYDIDSAHPLVEAHARMYVLDHKLKMHPLRLMDPNDDLGGVLYPSVPADIVHHIDHHSALSPRKLPLVERSNGLVLRSIDSYTGNRDEIICPVCGEAYGTYKRLQKHVEFNAMIEAKEGFPKEKSHCGFVLPDIEPLTLDEVRKHIEKSFSEIVVVVEAIDPQLSGTFQSLQSYKYEDIVFGAEFAKCMSFKGENFTVDMKKFHKTCNHQDQKRGCSQSSSGSLNVASSSAASSSTAERSRQFFETKNESVLSHISEGTAEDSENNSGSSSGGLDDEYGNEHIDDDDDDDDAISLENGGNYFRRSYNTFMSNRNVGVSNIFVSENSNNSFVNENSSNGDKYDNTRSYIV